MKILFISHHLYYSGGPISLFRFIKELKKETDLQISVLAFLDGPLRKKYENIGLTPIIEDLYDVNLGNIKKLQEIIKKEKADVVLSNTLDSINGCLAAHLSQKPGVLFVTQDWPQVNTSLLHLFAFKLSDLVLFSSKYQLSVYAPLLDGVRTQIIGNALPLDEFNPKSRLPADKKVVAIIGSVCDRKRQDLFIFAAQKILKKRNDIVFQIIGRCREESKYCQLLKKYIEMGGLSDNIRLLGTVENITEYYHSSDVIVCCSSNDVSPLVILEALAYKKPVIATAIDGIPELVKDGKNGILIAPNNQKELEAAIPKVLDNYDFYQKNIENDYEAFCAKYDIRTVAKDLLKAIQELKVQKNNYSLKLGKDNIDFAIKKDTVLKFKEITPVVVKKASSAFR